MSTKASDNAKDEQTKSPCKSSKQAVLQDLWIDQLVKQKEASERDYAKRHSLEMTLGRKIFAKHEDDQSNSTKRVA